VRGTAGIGGSAENLAGIVDSDSIRDGEARVGGSKCIEINQHAITVDKADMLAGPEWMVAFNGKDCGTDDLARGVDSRRRGPRSSRERAQVAPGAVVVGLNLAKVKTSAK
jgi:hypothetical protein